MPDGGWYDPSYAPHTFDNFHGFVGDDISMAVLVCLVCLGLVVVCLTVGHLVRLFVCGLSPGRLGVVALVVWLVLRSLYCLPGWLFLLRSSQF